MGERRRRSLEELSSEERAKLEAFRARHGSPEARAEEESVRRAVRDEFSPATPDPETLIALASLRTERERQGLSLADMAERTGLDRATLSKLETGKLANPTLATLRRYAQALGKRLSWAMEDLATPSR
ncbi:MAG: helix-turn-helix transcriptional regulator [Isosphaeraceae bacterium]